MQIPIQAVGKALKDAAQGVVSGKRVDGEKVKVHPYRRLMAHIMLGRNESVVYFDTYARAGKLLEYIEEAKGQFHLDVTHCLVGAVSIGVSENPAMNRFVAGRHLYQRNGCDITFSMKRQKLGRKAKLSAVKMRMGESENFRQLCERINGNINVERSTKKTSADKEFDLLDRLPRSVLNVATKALRGLDYWGALPKAFIDTDAMYTSVFIANLGSLGMSAGYHHLYEWGNCPVFMMVGAIEERALVVDGKMVIEPVIPIRYTFDERSDDGLNASYGIQAVNRVLEDPYGHLGCLKEDGSDIYSLSPGPKA